MECNTCYCAHAVRNVINGFEPSEQFPCCISWGHGEKCTTCSMIMAVKHSYSISCWDESHSFAIDDVDTSCLGHVTGLKKVVWKTC